MISSDINGIMKQIQQNIGIIFFKLIFWVITLEIRSTIGPDDVITKKSAGKLKVGDIIKINANQRVPADSILLHSS